MQYKDFFYVGLQFILFLVFFLADRYFDIGFKKLFIGAYIAAIGLFILIIAIVQLNKSLSPFPTPKENGSLITSGLYGQVRHPIYLGLLIFFFGYSLYSGSFFRLGILIILAILFHFKSAYEETKLLEKYPKYGEYKTKTSKIIPHL